MTTSVTSMAQKLPPVREELCARTAASCTAGAQSGPRSLPLWGAVNVEIVNGSAQTSSPTGFSESAKPSSQPLTE